MKTPWRCGPPGSVSSALAGGFVAGVAAAVVLILFRVAVEGFAIAAVLRLLPWHVPARVILRREFLVPLKIAAYPLFGDRVYTPGFDGPVVGLALAVLLLLSISIGVAFALVARGRSLMATCAIAIPFGFGVWMVELLFASPSPATLIEGVPSGLALACTYLWYERRLQLRR